MSKQTRASRTLRMLALLAILGLLAALALAACGGGTEPAEAPPAATAPAIDGANLLEARCSGCHDVDRATTAQKTQAEWEQTVTRMIAKGAQLNDAEKAALVEYLTQNYGN